MINPKCLLRRNRLQENPQTLMQRQRWLIEYYTIQGDCSWTAGLRSRLSGNENMLAFISAYNWNRPADVQEFYFLKVLSLALVVSL